MKNKYLNAENESSCKPPKLPPVMLKKDKKRLKKY